MRKCNWILTILFKIKEVRHKRHILYDSLYGQLLPNECRISLGVIKPFQKLDSGDGCIAFMNVASVTESCTGQISEFYLNKKSDAH